MENLDAQQRYQELERRVQALEQSAPEPPARRRETGPPLGPPPDPGEYTLQGKIQPGLVADVLRLISANVMTGVFQATSVGLELELFLDGGEIVHAAGSSLEGRDAVLATLELESGSFGFMETPVRPDQWTLDEETRYLVLRAMRQTDELHAAADKPQ